MTETVVLAPAGYAIDPDAGSDPERPWRLMRGLGERGIRVVAVTRSLARANELPPNVVVRLLPGRPPTTPVGRLLDRVRLYVHSRRVALSEVSEGSVLAIHHFGPCGRQSPSLIPKRGVPFIYGPLPGINKVTRGLGGGDWKRWLGVSNSSTVQTLAGFGISSGIGPVAHLLWLLTIARADRVIVEAKANRPPERPDATIIPPGIDTDLFSPTANDVVPGRIVAVGSLVPRKGIDLLIRAITIAAQEVKSLHLVVVGDGAARPELEKLTYQCGIDSRVRFVGGRRRDELPLVYRSAAALCHPARFDTFPLAPIEAMACATPVLASSVGGLPELVADTGLIHPAGDVALLARQIVELMRSPTLRRELGVRARQRAVAEYSSDVMCDRYIKLYLGLGSRTTAGFQAN